MHCDRCNRALVAEKDVIIDGGEFGYSDVCKWCMRTLEHGGDPALDLMAYCLPIRVAYGVELLETVKKPHWYFVRIGQDIVYQGEDLKDGLTNFNKHMEKAKYKQSALYRLANGIK